MRFYAQPAGNLRFLVQRSVDTWGAQFLYGEFRATLVADSTDADVIVLWSGSVPPDVPPDPGPPAYACTGVTSLPPLDASDRYTGPFHVQLSARPGFTGAQVAACLRPTAIHEVGHALGLFQHSPDTGDIMWAPSLSAPLAVDQPSEQDRRTVEVLYHTRATAFPPPP